MAAVLEAQLVVQTDRSDGVVHHHAPPQRHPVTTRGRGEVSWETWTNISYYNAYYKSLGMWTRCYNLNEGKLNRKTERMNLEGPTT